jgi:hypothetical protein
MRREDIVSELESRASSRRSMDGTHDPISH